jgi:hypothetical protein
MIHRVSQFGSDIEHVTRLHILVHIVYKAGLRIRIRIIFGSWIGIQVRIRVKSWTRIRTEGKIQKLGRLKKIRGWQWTLTNGGLENGALEVP